MRLEGRNIENATETTERTIDAKGKEVGKEVGKEETTEETTEVTETETEEDETETGAGATMTVAASETTRETGAGQVVPGVREGKEIEASVVVRSLVSADLFVLA